MKSILKGWNFFRRLRLITGIIVIITAIQMHIVLIGILGMMVIIQAIVNTTCCDSAVCDTKERNRL